MSIVIRNVSNSDPKFKGECTYRVSINLRPIAFFTHVRGDDLATCLRKAADAVEKAEGERAAK